MNNPQLNENSCRNAPSLLLKQEGWQVRCDIFGYTTPARLRIQAGSDVASFIKFF